MLTALWKLLLFFFKYWWLPVLTLILLVDAPTLLCSLLHLQVFQKTWPLTFTMKSLRFKLVLNFYRYLYGINFKLLCYLVLEFLQTYICTLPTGPAGLWCCFLKIIRLLCANRNNLSFLRETRMFKNAMLKPHALLKKHLENFWQKLWG